MSIALNLTVGQRGSDNVYGYGENRYGDLQPDTVGGNKIIEIRTLLGRVDIIFNGYSKADDLDTLRIVLDGQEYSLTYGDVDGYYTVFSSTASDYINNNNGNTIPVTFLDFEFVLDIKLGDLDVDNFMLGNVQVDKVMLGNNEVWTKQPDEVFKWIGKSVVAVTANVYGIETQGEYYRYYSSLSNGLAHGQWIKNELDTIGDGTSTQDDAGLFGFRTTDAQLQYLNFLGNGDGTVDWDINNGFIGSSLNATGVGFKASDDGGIIQSLDLSSPARDTEVCRLGYFPHNDAQLILSHFDWNNTASLNRTFTDVEIGFYGGSERTIIIGISSYADSSVQIPANVSVEGLGDATHIQGIVHTSNRSRIDFYYFDMTDDATDAQFIDILVSGLATTQRMAITTWSVVGYDMDLFDFSFVHGSTEPFPYDASVNTSDNGLVCVIATTSYATNSPAVWTGDVYRDHGTGNYWDISTAISPIAKTPMPIGITKASAANFLIVSASFKPK